MRTSRISIAALAVLALTACSGLPGGASATPTLKQEDSPLAQYLSSVVGGPGLDATKAEQQAFYDEQQRKVEEVTAKCMTEEGFEYAPGGSGSVTVGDAAKYRPDDRDWVAQYGYGMVTYPGQEAMATAEPTESTDPNQAYVESLTEAEQAAYQEALYGKPVETDRDENGGTEYTWEDAGCMGRAQHEVSGDSPFTEEAHKPLIEALTAFYTNLSADPGYEAVDGEWTACMKEAGIDGFSKQPKAQDSINQLISEYYEQMNEVPDKTDPDAATDPAFGTMDDPEYAAIAQKEVPLALADLDCRVKTNYRDRQLRIQFALEEQFIADHRAELDALKADAEQGRK